MEEPAGRRFTAFMSDRLKELQRQRALAQEQLGWFDHEIAREGGQAPALPLPAAPPDTGEAARAAEEILARYQKQGQTTEKDVKRGCYLYFIIGLGMLMLSALGAYLIYKNL